MIELEKDDRRIAAMLTRDGGRWVLRYRLGDKDVSRNLAPARVPWPTALRRALNDCEELLISGRH